MSTEVYRGIAALHNPLSLEQPPEFVPYRLCVLRISGNGDDECVEIVDIV